MIGDGASVPGRRGRRASPRPTSSSSTGDWCCCAPTTSARSSTTGRAGSAPTRSSGTTRRCRPARPSRSSDERLDLPELPRVGDRAAARDAARDVLSWWRGHPAGWWNPADYNVASICVPIATHVPHAAGLAWGKKLRGENACAIVVFGDGATSEGAFHEGANFAARHAGAARPLLQQQPLGDLDAGRGADGGRDARGQGGRLRHARRARRRADVLAVFEATREAVERARARRRADLHRGADLPRGAARDRRRPEGVHRPGARRGGARSASASGATRATCAGSGSSRTSIAETIRAEAADADARGDRRRRGRAARRPRRSSSSTRRRPAAVVRARPRRAAADPRWLS